MALAIVDSRISEKTSRRLEILGFNTIKLPPSISLSEPIASHPDMLMFLHNNTLITSCTYCDEAAFVFSDIREYSPDTKIVFADEEFSPKYPNDAIYNALVIGNRLFCKSDTVSRTVLEYAKAANLKIHSTKQGYPACTTLALGDKHAITADPGMAKVMSDAKIEVLLIENGGISLPPYEYGFIGGCAGVYKNTVYFIGNPASLPSSKKIISFCKTAGFEVTPLSDEPLSDLGRILFI